jgi:hypothetical protein
MWGAVGKRGGSFNNEARDVRGVYHGRDYPWDLNTQGVSLRVCVWL